MKPTWAVGGNTLSIVSEIIRYLFAMNSQVTDVHLRRHIIMTSWFAVSIYS